MILSQCVNKMVSYKVVAIRMTASDTENMLNALSKDGWKVKCSYARNNLYLILEKN